MMKRFASVAAVVVTTATWKPIRTDAFSLFQLSHPTSSSSSWSCDNNNNNNNIQHRFTQVISDVDDTLKSSGGVNVAGIALGGIDVEYERNDMYPGVAEFLYELSSSSLVSSSSSVQSSASAAVPKVAILTARAEEFKAALELKPTSSLAKALRQAGRRQQQQQQGGRDDNNEDPDESTSNEWGVGPVLYGSVAEWIAQFRKGLRKFTNFERLLAQDPNHQIFQYVYLGDTGELDQEAGETMLREYPHLVQAVFLHVVSGDSSNQARVPVPPLRFINGRPLVFFRTYVGAAAMAVQLDLMTPAGLERVVAAAESQLKEVPKSSSKWINLQRDVDRARAQGLYPVKN